MESSFHVIHEYEILKKILSNLNCRDLRVASTVCQNWKRVADIIIEKRLDVLCYLKRGGKWPPFSMDVLPKLVFYNTDEEKGALPKELKEYVDHFRDSKDFYCIYLMNWRFINTLREGSDYIIHRTCFEDCNNSNLNFKESVLIIPEFKHLQIGVEYIDFKSKFKLDLNSTKKKLKQTKSCIFIIGSKLKKVLNVIKTMCDALEEDGQDLIMAGGVAHCMKRVDGSFEDTAGVLITFNGHNLTSVSFVIPHEGDLATSFTKMSEELGPLEPGYERLAFIFTCVDRYLIYYQRELKEFSKYFPDVCLHGFWSLGELCSGYTPLLDKRSKPSASSMTSKGSQFFFQQASTFLFITFKK